MSDSFIPQAPFTLYIDMAQMPIAFQRFLLWGLQKKEQTRKTKESPAFTEGSFGKGLGKVLTTAFTFPPVCAFQLTREFFTKELKKHYQRNNDTDVFSSTWNSVMITVSQTAPVPLRPRSVATNTLLSPHSQLSQGQPVSTTLLCPA